MAGDGAGVMCHIFDKDGRKLLRTEEREPVCGQDFCDRCGDCLSCYGSDHCYDGDDGNSEVEHFWVQYGETAP